MSAPDVWLWFSGFWGGVAVMNAVYLILIPMMKKHAIAAALILLSGCAVPEPQPRNDGRWCNPGNPPGICCAQYYTPDQRLHLRDQCP